MTIQLRQHQDKGAGIVASVPRFGLFFDCGAGKTITVLEGIRRFGKGKWVVVCPLSVVENAWLRDAAALGFTAIHSVAEKPPGERKRIIESVKSGVVVVNFDVYAKHVDDFIRCGYRKLVIDESSRMKNPDAVQCRAILRHAATCDRFYALSGTPAPNGDHELWAQLRAIAPDRIDASPHQFWYRWFTPRVEWVRVKGGQQRKVIKGWDIKPDREPDFRNLVASVSWTLRKEDCMDLPPQTDMIRAVRLSGPELAAYDRVVNELKMMVRQHGVTREVRVKACSAIHKLRQLCGGWAYSDGQATEYGAAKLNELDGLLDEIGHKQVVLWVDFRHDAARVCGLLGDRKKSFRRLIGGGDPVAESVRAFQAHDVDALVCHPQSVGHGVTMTAAHHAVYYTLPWSYELYKQSRDRVHRMGQAVPVTYHHLLASETVDLQVLDVVRTKKASREAMNECLAALGVDLTVTEQEAEHDDGGSEC